MLFLIWCGRTFRDHSADFSLLARARVRKAAMSVFCPDNSCATIQGRVALLGGGGMNIVRMVATAVCLLSAGPAWAQPVQRAPEEMSQNWRKDAIRRVMARVSASKPQLQKAQQEARLGNVAVAVQVEFKSNGQIASARVARSSGNPQFDRAVESVVGRPGPMPSLSWGKARQRVTLVVPLQFGAPPAH